MTCKRCKSENILSVTGKTSDRCFVQFNGRGFDGYVPRNLGIGRGDYLKFELCLNCGQLQEDFPISDGAIRDFLSDQSGM